MLPPLIIISVISLFYQAFRANPIVNLAMTGMLAGVAGGAVRRGVHHGPGRSSDRGSGCCRRC